MCQTKKRECGAPLGNAGGYLCPIERVRVCYNCFYKNNGRYPNENDQ